MPECPGHAAARRKPRILFVCYGNSCRSQIAETFARRYGMGFLTAISAGIAPSLRVSNRARETMNERGIPLSPLALPKPLLLFDLSSFDLIVNMTEFSLPAASSPILKMHMPDMRVVGDDVLREIRDEIERQVIDIVDTFRPKPTFRAILLATDPTRAAA